MKLIPLILLVAPLAACTTTPTSSAEDGYARFGERTFVDGPYVTPVALVEDSRCPINARCVWEGRLRITADVTTGPGTQQMELTLGVPVLVADGAVELVEAAPLPETGTGIKPGDYRFKFRFDGGF